MSVMTIEHATILYNEEFTKHEKKHSPVIVMETVRGEEVSEAFILYCKGKDLL